jgi:hypothetical protein
LDCECDMCIFDLLMSLFLICFQAKPSRDSVILHDICSSSNR